VLDWITPKGQSLVPSLSRNVKIDRGFHHERTGALLCPAGLDWSHLECVITCLSFSLASILITFRTRAKLQSGEIVVTGDQWPLFLYADYHYDPEDPWNGLLRSALLVCVSSKLASRFQIVYAHLDRYRLINTSLPPPVLWTESQKQLVRVTLEFTG
jgi:hypothetical protein